MIDVEGGVEVEFPPGQDPGENTALLGGPGGREVAVNVTESLLAHLKEEDRTVDAAVQRTSKVDRDVVNEFATWHGGDLDVFVVGRKTGGGNDATSLDLNWLETVADPQVYGPNAELADDLFAETTVGDREVSVNPIKTEGSYQETRQTALDVRLVEPDETDRGVTDRLRGAVREFRDRPTRDAPDNRASMLLTGGGYSRRYDPLHGLGSRLRDGTPAVGVVTHPNPTGSSREEMLDELGHDVVVFTGGEYTNDRSESVEARGARVVYVDEEAVNLGVMPDGVTVVNRQGREDENLTDGFRKNLDQSQRAGRGGNGPSGQNV